MTAAMMLRLTVEDFLYREAALLDDWKLKEWLALFSPSARYEVAPTGDPKRGRSRRRNRCSSWRTTGSASNSG